MMLGNMQALQLAMVVYCGLMLREMQKRIFKSVQYIAKVFTRILLDRMKGALDEKLRASPLYINFINFEKAFDSVDRDVIWMLMHHYGIQQNL